MKPDENENLDADKDALLREYEISSAKAINIEDLVWKTFSMIGLVSVTLLISDKILSDMIGWRVFIFLGSLSISLNILWWKIASRWWDIQATLYLRIKHIEEDLHLFSNRYISSRDGVMQSREKEIFNSEIKNEERKKGVQYNYSFAKKGIQKYLSTILLIIPLSWVARILITLPSFIKIKNIDRLFLFDNFVTLIITVYFSAISILSFIEYFALYSKTKKNIMLAFLKSIKTTSIESIDIRMLSRDDRKMIKKCIREQEKIENMKLTKDIKDEIVRIFGKT